jgi:predicted methyltransferase
MKITVKKLSLVVPLMIGWAVTGSAVAESWSATELSAALDQSDRSEADRARDEARRPAEVLVFIDIEPGMTVLDVMASGGWYTEVLSVAAGDAGTVYAQNPQSYLERRDGANDEALTARLANGRLPNVERIDGELGEIDIAPDSIDVAFTALNFHDTYNFNGAEAATGFLANIYSVLKLGGVLALIDHNGDPDQQNTKLHRIPKQVVIELAEGAGFIVEAESDLLAHPEDDRTEMVFGKIRGKTDRFLLKLRKPG